MLANKKENGKGFADRIFAIWRFLEILASMEMGFLDKHGLGFRIAGDCRLVECVVVLRDGNE